MRVYLLTRKWKIATVLLLLAGCSDEPLGPVGVSPTPTRTPTPTTTATPSATPVPLTSEKVAARGPFGIGVTTVMYEDPSRPTMANGSYAGASSRRLVTEIVYPTSDGTTAVPQRNAPLATGERPFPLIMYSHGFASFRTEGGTLARHLASHGYIVASPDFPLTNLLAPGGPNAADVVEQPRDVGFLIDRLHARNTDRRDEWFGAIDEERIGIVGLSLGGLTTLLTAFDPTLRDVRVRAAAAMAPRACMLAEEIYDSARLPLLILAGDIDAIVPYEENARAAYEDANAPKYLVTILGASHAGFADAGAAFEQMNNPDEPSCDALGGASGGVDEVADGACPDRCAGPFPLPRAIRPSRQRRLTVLTVFPFLEATLRDNAAARGFLQAVLAEENAEIRVQFAAEQQKQPPGTL